MSASPAGWYPQEDGRLRYWDGQQVARPIVFPVTITLREITVDNAESVLALRTTPEQERFVSTVADSLAEADANPQGSPWFRAVYADGQPVGFVMLSWDVEPQPPEINGPWFLWKLLIDHKHQGKVTAGRSCDRSWSWCAIRVPPS